MIKGLNMKRANSLHFIDPEKLHALDPSSIVIVNRVALNNKRVQIECLPQQHSKEIIAIVYRVAHEMRIQDKKLRRPSFGANMTAKEARLVFNNLNTLPKNTFAEMLRF
ncbi:MAG: hypothetical protein HDR53_00695 [Treponema sp.]|nr:hypothetical protein [Treponema sp.]